MRALILAAALCGCQYADIAAPVESPVRTVAGPGWCGQMVEYPEAYDAADSSATCWDGSRPHMVEYWRPRLAGKSCAESAYLPEWRTMRKFGCTKRTTWDPI